jgi:hypothetical protein
MSRLWTQGPPERAAWAAAAHAVRVEDELSRRGIQLKGRIDRCGPCPVCGGTDRFAINTKKQVFNCRGCGKSGDVISLVQALDGSNYLDAIATLAGAAPIRIDYNIPKQPALVPKQRKEELPNGTGPLALALWRAARDPRGTIVEFYLRSRCLDLPDEAAGDSIRFHSHCPFGEARYPAMVCMVRNILTNEPQAIHRTALTPDGPAIKHDGKTFRLTLGPIAGGAIKLAPDEDVTQGLCIGEGIETSLSAAQMGMRPVWSIISTSGMAAFPTLPGIDGLTVLREQCPANAAAFQTCSDRWRADHRQVISAWPSNGKDANDELRGSYAIRN